MNSKILLTVGTETYSVHGWSVVTGIPEASLRYRYHQGWSPTQILGKTSPPERHRSKEQRAVGLARAMVVIVDNTDQIIPRDEVAKRLSLSPAALNQRLRKFRVGGKIAQVKLEHLMDEVIKRRARGVG